MSKKRLNKKGQQAKKNINNAQRIDGEKTIYEVDGKVQVFSENECAEEAHIDGGVVTEETLVVDATNGDVIDAEYEEVDDYYLDDEDEDDDIDVEEFGDIVEEDRFADEATESDIVTDTMNFSTSGILQRAREMDKTLKGETAESVVLATYADVIINAFHDDCVATDQRITRDVTTKWMKSGDRGLANMVIPNAVYFISSFINWNGTGYLNTAEVFDALMCQYTDFINDKSVLNNPNIDNIYYAKDVKSMTPGCIAYRGSIGSAPIHGNTVRIQITVINDAVDEFINEYTTKAVITQTSDRVPDEVMQKVAKGIAIINGMYSCYVVNMPKFLKMFEGARDVIHKSKYSWSATSPDGKYQIMFSQYNDVDVHPARLFASPYKTALSMGLMKSMFC